MSSLKEKLHKLVVLGFGLAMALLPTTANAVTTDDDHYLGFRTDTVLVSDGAILTPSSVKTGDLIHSPEPSHAPAAVRTFKKEDKLPKIAVCESHGDLYAKNPRSTAKGKYQFLDSSWKYYGTQLWGTVEGHSVFSEKDQDELARYVVSKRGYTDWLASKDCWGK